MNEGFKAGSIEHLVVIFITVFIFLLLFYWGKKYKTHPALRLLDFLLAGILILNFAALNYYRIEKGLWDVRYDLPMELCSWATIAVIFALITRKQWLVELSYFWVLSGSIHGLITPDLSFSFPHIYFISFFIGHSLLVAAALYPVFGLEIYPKKGAVIRAVLFSEIYFFTAIILNISIGANYGYLINKPFSVSFLDFLGPWPYYIIAMQMIGIVFFLILYYPFYLRDRFLEKNS
ncbi:MAG: TIGR02206 family membrane protein [Spirochaetia bacterium]|nr:TIGR02206 family membrane protein [Spirochaetia bacterium]